LLSKSLKDEIMDLKELKTEKLKQIRECLVGEYIGEWKKPKQYFNQLKKIDAELKTRSDFHGIEVEFDLDKLPTEEEYLKYFKGDDE
jgi:hypothetical protein